MNQSINFLKVGGFYITVQRLWLLNTKVLEIRMIVQLYYQLIVNTGADRSLSLNMTAIENELNEVQTFEIGNYREKPEEKGQN